MSGERVALGAGLVSLALILGALGFQYLGGLPPCEMCHWQRWPHIAAAILGILGSASIAFGLVERRNAVPLAWLVLLLLVVSGAIGAYQAGVEWEILPGPAACTGKALEVTGSLDLNHAVVRCDIAAFRLFGLSLAGYNALISFATVGLGIYVVTRRRRIF
jgi:disulfide bond formation protein DsbB